jgi:SAM-dependent methyltransferase
LRGLGCDFDLVRADVKSLPFRDSAFTSAVCLEVLQYIDDDRACLSEIGRVLLPGSSLVVSVPNRDFPVLYDPFNWILTRLGVHPARVGIWFWGDQLRLYSSRGLLDLLAGVGLEVSGVRFVGTWIAPLLESYISSLIYSLMPGSEKPSYIGKPTTSPHRSSSIRRRLSSLTTVLNFVADLDERPGVPVGTHILVSAVKPGHAHL